MKGDRVLSFSEAFKYPFNRAVRMWNILWLFLPIFGWLALGGYGVRIVQEFSNGKFKQLPKMKFSNDMKLGFFMFVKAIPFIFAYIIAVVILGEIPFGFLGNIFLSIFVLPIMFVHFMNKQTMKSLFEFNIVDSVFSNIEDYFISILKSIGLALIFLIMFIILVGIPAGQFTKNVFLADFYRRNIGK